MTCFPPGGSAGGGGGAGSDTTAVHVDQAGEIAAIALVTVAAGDHILIEDVGDSNNKKRVLASDLIGGAGAALSTVLGLGDTTGNNVIEFSGTSLGITSTIGSASVGKTLNIRTGAGDAAFAGGTLDIRPGTGGLTGAGGQLNLVAGNSGASGGIGGDTFIGGGSSFTSTGGFVTINGGAAAAAQAGGAVVIAGADGLTTGAGGIVFVDGGDSASGTAGEVIVGSQSGGGLRVGTTTTATAPGDVAFGQSGGNEVTWTNATARFIVSGAGGDSFQIGAPSFPNMYVCNESAVTNALIGVAALAAGTTGTEAAGFGGTLALLRDGNNNCAQIQWGIDDVTGLNDTFLNFVASDQSSGLVDVLTLVGSDQSARIAGTAAGLYAGTGVPSVAAADGSLFLRTDGGASSLYVRESGAWVVK